MMWIFEWDILTGDSAVLDVIYAISRATGVDEAIAGGEQAVAAVERMRDLVAGDGCRDLARPGAARARSSAPSTTRSTCCGCSPRTAR